MVTLKELEDKLLKSSALRNKVVAKSKDILSLIEDCTENLRNLRREVQEFNHLCNGVRVGSTAVSTVGAAFSVAGFALAPFTAGTSLAVCETLGLVYTLAGSAVKIGTDVVDSRKTANYIKTIQSLLSSLQNVVEDFNAIEKEYGQVLSYLQDVFQLEDVNISGLVSRFWAKYESTPANMRMASQPANVVGILLMTLAMLQPCSAQNVQYIMANYLNYETTVMVGISLPLIYKLKLINSASTAAAKVVVKEVAKNVAQHQAKEIGTKEIAKDVALLAGKNGKEALKMIGSSVGIGINLVFAVHDIASLFKSLNSSHVATQQIDEILNKLSVSEAQVHEKLKVLTDYAIEMREQIRQQRDEEEDEEEDEDEIRIFDISPQMLKSHFQSGRILEIPSADNYKHLSFRGLATELEKMLKSTMDLSTYFSLMAILEVIICQRKGIFKRDSKEIPSTIRLIFHQEEVIFQERVRNDLRDFLLPIFFLLRQRIEVSPIACIYRFHCLDCKRNDGEVSYVGQTNNLERRFSEHMTKFRKNFPNFQGFLNSNHLYPHGHNHISSTNGKKFTDIIEFYVVHRLPGFEAKSDYPVRRSWEKFYQWLFLALVREEDGGFSIM